MLSHFMGGKAEDGRGNANAGDDGVVIEPEGRREGASGHHQSAGDGVTGEGVGRVPQVAGDAGHGHRQTEKEGAQHQQVQDMRTAHQWLHYIIELALLQSDKCP